MWFLDSSIPAGRLQPKRKSLSHLLYAAQKVGCHCCGGASGSRERRERRSDHRISDPVGEQVEIQNTFQCIYFYFSLVWVSTANIN